MTRFKKYLTLIGLVAVATVILAGCATFKEQYVPEDNEVIYGTWTNENYNEGTDLVKLVMNPDLTYEQYNTFRDLPPYFKGKYVIEKKWSDDEGNTWYWVKKFMRSKTKYELAVVTADGKSYANAFDYAKYPTERRLSHGNTKARIFYKE
jgi:hypothetical protein